MNWPTFLLIGAAKSGTTALYRYLQQHPEVFLTTPKEPRFFAFEGQTPTFNGLRGTEWKKDFRTRREDYQALFTGAEGKAAGEASVMYLSEPGTAERIRRYVPDVKLMVILRNPVERAYSNFAYMRAEGREPIADFSEALEAEEERRRDNWISWFFYQGRGMYGQLLEPYYALFPREQIRVWLYEDLVADAGRVVREAFGYLGVDQDFPAAVDRRHNETRAYRFPALARWAGAASAIGRWNTLPKPAFPEAARKRLQESFREDRQRLERLIRRDLRHWNRD